MIEIKDLSLTFKNADEDHEALKAVTLDIPEGCIYGFVGSNGAHDVTCGKDVINLYRPTKSSRHQYDSLYEAFPKCSAAKLFFQSRFYL